MDEDCLRIIWTGRIRAENRKGTLEFGRETWELGLRNTNFIVEHDSRGSLHLRKHVFQILESGIMINETWPPLIAALNGSQVEHFGQ